VLGAIQYVGERVASRRRSAQARVRTYLRRRVRSSWTRCLVVLFVLIIIIVVIIVIIVLLTAADTSVEYSIGALESPAVSACEGAVPCVKSDNGAPSFH